MIGRFSSLGSYRELLNKRDFLRAAAGGLLTLASFIFESAMSAPPIVSIALALLSICINGFPIVWNAVKGLIKKEVNVDELVSIAIISSISTGEFLTAATVSFVMVIGSLIEQATSQSARKAIHALIKLSPKNATVLDQGAELVKPIEKIRVGDILLVKPGDRIPVDGVIAGGTSAVDESSITGEAMPSEKTIGDAVFSGTLSQNGVIKIKATKVGEDSTLGKVIRMVTGAEAHKPVSVRVIDKFAGWFTPAILCAAGITWAVTGQFSRAVAVLIVGCPCALILAAPTAVVATIGRAARSGILIKGGQFIEKISSATMICFDKTGTLTEGDPRVDDVITEGELNREYVLKLAAGVEQHSTHPLARAVLKAAAYAKITVRAAENMLTEIGSGIKGLIDGNVIEVGSAYLQGAAVALPVGLKASLSLIKERGATPIVVYENRQPIGIISVADHIRPQARETIQALKRMNIKRIGILSGDHEKSVRLVGDAVGCTDIWNDLKPQDKLKIIEQLQEAGSRILYIGDGINDAPALAAADVGIAMGAKGTEVALETADVALMHDDIERLPFLVMLSKRMQKTIKVNIAFGLAFNLAAVIASGCGFLTPIMGAVVHNIGSVIVVISSASIGFAKEIPPGGERQRRA